jgi:para-nitrobenzyl esterase
MATAPAAGLFQRAIVESVGRWERLRSKATAEADGIAAAAQWHLAADATAAQLRAVPVDQLLHTDGALDPVVDGRLVRVDPGVVYAVGREPHVALMIGTNSDEGSLFGGDTAGFLSGFTSEELATARTLYPGLDDAALARTMFGDAYFATLARASRLDARTDVRLSLQLHPPHAARPHARRVPRRGDPVRVRFLEGLPRRRQFPERR